MIFKLCTFICTVDFRDVSETKGFFLLTSAQANLSLNDNLEDHTGGFACFSQLTTNVILHDCQLFVSQKHLFQFISDLLLAVQFIMQECRPYQQTTLTAAE